MKAETLSLYDVQCLLTDSEEEQKPNKKKQFKEEVKPIRELIRKLGIENPRILIDFLCVTETIWREWMSGWRRMPEEYQEKVLRYLNQDDKKKKISFFL